MAQEHRSEPQGTYYHPHGATPTAGTGKCVFVTDIVAILLLFAFSYVLNAQYINDIQLYLPKLRQLQEITNTSSTVYARSRYQREFSVRRFEVL